METHHIFSLAGLLPEELSELLLELGEKKYRARQLLEWFYKKGVQDFSEMTNLPVSLQERLSKRLRLVTIQLKEKAESIDRTTKFLFQLSDNSLIESVLIPQDLPHQVRNTVCLSTQVGCPYACKFCASGKTGFVRDLNTGEIVEQLLWIQRELKPKPVNNVVFMGMGEPLANYDNVMKAVRIINSPLCAGIGSRKMTISTCGLIPGIIRLAKEEIQIELSISLHAPDDKTRNFLLPVNKRYPIATLLSACKEYIRKTNRQLTFEYILIQGLNDSPLHARELGKILKGMNCKVNLIPYNEVEGVEFKPAGLEGIRDFRRVLYNAGVRSFIRQSRGEDIEGACGQLILKRL